MTAHRGRAVDGVCAPGHTARALEIVGTRELLAKRFNVRPTVVDAWLSGSTPIPESVFLAAVDILQPRLSDEDTAP